MSTGKYSNTNRKWPTLLIFTLALIVVITFPVSASVGPIGINLTIDAPWPMWRSNPAHTGVANGSGPRNLAVKWKYNASAPLDSSPTVVGNRVYIGSRDHNLYCVDAQTGSLIWKYLTGWKIRSTPAVVNEKVYSGADDGNIYCLDAVTGQLLWKTPTEGGLIMTVLQPIAQIRSSPAVVDDRVYVGHLDRYVYCLDANTGTILWKYKAWDRVASSPAIVEGKVYVGACDGSVYCLSTTNGKRLWSYDTTKDNPHPSPSRTEVNASPCVVNGVLFVYGNSGFWHALDATTGAVKWRYLINSYRGVTGASSSMPHGSVACADGKVYFVDLSYAACADADSGKILWEKSLGFLSYSSPAYAIGKIYIGGDSTLIHVFDSKTGEKLSAYEIGSNIRSSCSIAHGNLYVGSSDWNLYCFTEAPPNPPKTKTLIISTISATNVTVGTPITVKGTIMTVPEAAEVTVVFKRPDGSKKTLLAVVKEDGTYEVSYKPEIVGTWGVQAWWDGSDFHEAAFAKEIAFTVTNVPVPPTSELAKLPIESVIVAVLLIALALILGIIRRRRKRAKEP